MVEEKYFHGSCYDCHNLKKDLTCKIYGFERSEEEVHLVRECASYHSAKDIYYVTTPPCLNVPTKIILTKKEKKTIAILIIIAILSILMEIASW